MPPKPWLTKPSKIANEPNISEIIQSNLTAKEEVPKITGGMVVPPSQISKEGHPALAAISPYALGAGSPYESAYGGGVGSSYGMGGLGGYSSYGGGLGGMSGMGGMYGGGMYGGGMYGMMGGLDQNGALFNSMVALQSFGVLVNSLCDIARSMDQNYEGIQMFKTSSKNLSNKISTGITDSVVGAKNKTTNFFRNIYQFFKNYILCLGQKDERSKFRAVKIVMLLSFLTILATFYPQMKNYLKAKA